MTTVGDLQVALANLDSGKKLGLSVFQHANNGLLCLYLKIDADKVTITPDIDFPAWLRKPEVELETIKLGKNWYDPEPK